MRVSERRRIIWPVNLECHKQKRYQIVSIRRKRCVYFNIYEGKRVLRLPILASTCSIYLTN